MNLRRISALSAISAISAIGLISLPLLALPASAAGAPPAPVLSSTASVSSADHATEVLGDPWDFSSSSDWGPQIKGDSSHGSSLENVSLAGGILSFDADSSSDRVSLSQSWKQWALPWGRDGSLVPIDADRFTKLSFRMKLDQGTSAGIFWFNCGLASSQCQGGTPFSTTPGWHVYDIDLSTATTYPNLDEGWDGLIDTLWLVPSTKSNHVELDWVRLYKPAGQRTLTYSDPTPGSIDIVADNGSKQLTIATVSGTSASGNTYQFDPGMLPPGTWTFRVRDGGTLSSPSAAISVTSTPAPVVLDPDRAGGLDYASVYRNGDRWNMSQPSDVLKVVNATTSFSGGILHGQNAGPQRNDPNVAMRLGSSGRVDGSRWHRMTVDVWHDGEFRLDNNPGGGMNARVIYKVAGNDDFQDSEDIIIYPGWNQMTLELATNPPKAVHEFDKVAWDGEQITLVRFDPNEDPGARRWKISDVRLAEDDTAYGKFDIRFRDAAWAPGTVADIRLDNNRSGNNGSIVLATGVPVSSGTNTWTLPADSVSPGTYWVQLTMRRGGKSRTSYSTGPLRISSSANTPTTGFSPFGGYDSATAVNGGVRVSGWAIEPDLVGPARIHVYVDGKPVHSALADASRSDVGAAYPTWGPKHGFSVTVPVDDGPHNVCVFAINEGEGSSKLLGCKTVADTEPDRLLWVGDTTSHSWAGVGNGTFASTALATNAPGAEHLVGDFDGDSTEDVILYNAGPGADALVRYDANGNPSVRRLTIDGDYIPLIGRFAGNDQRDDVIWYRPGRGTDHLWKGTGAGVFTSSVLPPINGSYEPLVGDFDGDGATDIFWYAPGPRADYVWWGNNRGGFSSAAWPVQGDYQVLLGDYNGDGRTDLYWYRPGPIRDYLWLSRGRTFASTFLPVDGVFTPILGDYDGDGRDDIFWYRPGPGGDYVWFNLPALRSAPLPVSTTYQVVSGRFAGNDDRDDLFFYAPGTGRDYLVRSEGGDRFTSIRQSINGTFTPVVARQR